MEATQDSNFPSAILHSPFSILHYPVDPRESKSQLRQAIKDRLARLSARDRSAGSRSLCRRILEALPPAPIGICAYYPLSDEADILPVFGELQKRGDIIYLPAHEAGKLVFRTMTSIEDLVPGDFGIPEPPTDAERPEPEDLDIILVPGRAYDRAGRRLGRGNGGYDIWIRKQRAENSKTQFWGIALECQIVQDIPMEAHDETVDAIVTARGLETCMGK